MSDYQRGYADAVNDIRGDITAMRDNCISQRGRIAEALAEGGRSFLGQAEAAEHRVQVREEILSAVLRLIEATQAAKEKEAGT